MDSQEKEFSTSEVTLRSVDERIKQTTDSILRLVEELCPLEASGAKIESTAISKVTSSSHDNISSSFSGHRHDRGIFQFHIKFCLGKIFRHCKKGMTMWFFSILAENGRKIIHSPQTTCFLGELVNCKILEKSCKFDLEIF